MAGFDAQLKASRVHRILYYIISSVEPSKFEPLLEVNVSQPTLASPVLGANLGTLYPPNLLNLMA